MSNSSAKFKVAMFNITYNFGLWQRRGKVLLAQQGLQKALRKEKSKDMEEVDWMKMKDKATRMIRLCIK